MFDWIGDLTNGMGDAISNSLAKTWETISNSIWDKLMQWIYTAIYGALADFFSLMGGMGIKLFDLKWVEAVIKLFSLFGWALFVCGLVVSIFDIAIESQGQGRVNLRTTAINCLKGFFAVNLFTVVPIELYKFCVSLQNIFAKDLASIFAGTQGFDIAKQATQVLASTVSTNIGLFQLFLLIALGYCVVKIFFANIIRGGILLIQISVGSLYMFSIPRGYTDGFNNWCKQIIALCLTTFMQTTLLFLGLITWNVDMLLAVGIMMAANEVPRIAQQFGLDSSVKVNMMSAVHTTTTAVNLTKSLFKK